MKAARKKGKKKKRYLAYRRTVIQLTVDFSSETMEDRRYWNNTIKVLKKKLSLIILYLTKCPSKMNVK